VNLILIVQVAQMMLDGKELKFYQYNGDVNELLDGVRASLNELAEHWTREQKDHCLRETADAFQVGVVDVVDDILQVLCLAYRWKAASAVGASLCSIR
jgi:hypothetical protein